MFEEQRQLLSKISSNALTIIQLEAENKNLNEEFLSSVSNLVGKCYAQSRPTKFGCRYARTSQHNLCGEFIETLDNVIQIIGIRGNKFVLHQAEEVINEVTPENRLTWKDSIFEYDIEKFVSYDRSEISLDEYLERIKRMQDRDSYTSWKTAITIYA